jgi:hypothetical protein
VARLDREICTVSAFSAMLDLSLIHRRTCLVISLWTGTAALEMPTRYSSDCRRFDQILLTRNDEELL